MKAIPITFLLATVACAADIRCTWLPTQTNVVGLDQTTTEVTYFGVQVFMDTDNPQVTEFVITLVIRTAAGEVRSLTGTAPRAAGKAENVRYSTAWSALVDTSAAFEVLAISVKASSQRNVTTPIPGKEYESRP